MMMIHCPVVVVAGNVSRCFSLYIFVDFNFLLLIFKYYVLKEDALEIKVRNNEFAEAGLSGPVWIGGSFGHTCSFPGL